MNVMTLDAMYNLDNVMVMDAEFNQPSRKCIQIGAAVFDARKGTMLDRLEIYINPGELITEEITKLTGIKDSDVVNGMTMRDAYEELKRFHKKYKCFRNPMVWGSGIRNDSSAIYDEYVAFMLSTKEDLPDENFMGFRVIDVKTIYQSVAIFENSQYAGGLEPTMKKIGLEFEGKAHTALADAINTFRVWFYLMRIFHDGKKVKNS